MNKKPFTCIGHWQQSPGEATVFYVEATDVRSAIEAADEMAYVEANRLPPSQLDPYINLFVIEGHPEILSTWAG